MSCLGVVSGIYPSKGTLFVVVVGISLAMLSFLTKDLLMHMPFGCHLHTYGGVSSKTVPS